MPEFLLIGGGHAHVVALRHLARARERNLSLTLVSPDAQSFYSGLLPGVIAGHWPAADMQIDLRALCETVGAEFCIGEVTGLEPALRRARLKGGEERAFNFASVNVGAAPRALQVPNEIAVKPISAFLARLEAFLAAPLKRALTLSVIGGGLGGIEIVLALAHHLRHLPEAKLHLIERADEVLPGGAPHLRRILMNALNRARVQIHTSSTDKSVEADAVERSDLIINTTGAAPPEWLQGADLELRNGAIAVDSHLRAVRHSHIWAAGDASYFVDDPRPRAGVFAVRQGETLAENMLAIARNQPLKAYDPQADYLKLVLLGEKSVAAEKWGQAFASPALYALKRHIDFSFVSGPRPRAK